MASSPTQRTLKKWRDAGYMAAVVEKWNPHARLRQDLYGFIDILAVGNGETVAIQSCHYSDVAKRVAKIGELQDRVDVIKDAGWRIVVEGWHKPKHRYVCREVEL